MNRPVDCVTDSRDMVIYQPNIFAQTLFQRVVEYLQSFSQEEKRRIIRSLQQSVSRSNVGNRWVVDNIRIFFGHINSIPRAMYDDHDRFYNPNYLQPIRIRRTNLVEDNTMNRWHHIIDRKLYTEEPSERCEERIKEMIGSDRIESRPLFQAPHSGFNMIMVNEPPSGSRISTSNQTLSTHHMSVSNYNQLFGRTLGGIGSISLIQTTVRMAQTLPFPIADFDGDPMQCYFDGWDGTDQEILIDPNTISIVDLLEIVRDNRDNIRFEYKDGHNEGIGAGSDRHCKSVVLKRIIDECFEHDGMFIIPKYDHSVFDIMNVDNLMKIIRSCRTSGVLISGHFHPSVVEVMINRPLQRFELEYYLELMDPTFYKYAHGLDEKYKSEKKLYQQDIATGHDSYDLMIREKVIGKELTDDQNDLIRRMDMDLLEYQSAVELDLMISEPYQYDRSQIIDMFEINFDDSYSDYEYSDKWNHLIISLSDQEIRSMLILFTGSTSIDKTISLGIRHMPLYDHSTESTDIEIHSCNNTVYISHRIIDSQETLDGIRIYFSDHNDSMHG
jgi:hypothetical protein